MIRILFILSVLSACVVNAQQTGQIEWVKSYGGNLSDGGSGGFHFTKDGYLLYGGSSESYTHNLTCNTQSIEGIGWLLKLDTLGNVIYSLCYNKAGFGDMITTRDSGCIAGSISGYCYNNDSEYLAVHKIDKNGNEQWLQCYGGGQEDGIVSIDTTRDGGYIFLDQTRSNGGEVGVRPTNDPFIPNAWLVKIDSMGNIQWKRVLGGTSGDYPNKVKQIAPGRYLTMINTISTDSMLTGLPVYFTSFSGNNDWFCIFDSGGNIIQQAILPWWGEKVMNDVALTSDGGYIMCGSAYREPFGIAGTSTYNANCTTNDSLNGDFAIFKLDSSFNIQWCWTEGGEYLDYLWSITALSDTTFLAVGYSTSPDFNASSLCKINPSTNTEEGWIYCIDIHGTILWRRCFSGSNGAFLFESLYNELTSSIYIAGGGNSTDGDLTGVPNYGEADEWIIKMEILPATGISTIPGINVKIYPNPTLNKLKIEAGGIQQNTTEIGIYDIMGRLLYTTGLLYPETEIDMSGYVDGVYVVKIYNSGGQLTQKIIKQ